MPHVICLPQQDKDALATHALAHALATHALAYARARDALALALACHNKTIPQ